MKCGERLFGLFNACNASYAKIVIQTLKDAPPYADLKEKKAKQIENRIGSSACVGCIRHLERMHTMANETLTAKELAVLASKRMQRNVTPKEFRRFVRSQASGDDRIIGACGQGNRYAVNVTDAKKLLDAFASWAAERGTSVPARPIADLEKLIGN